MQRADIKLGPQISGIMVLLFVQWGMESEGWLIKTEKALLALHKKSDNHHLQITQPQCEGVQLPP